MQASTLPNQALEDALQRFGPRIAQLCQRLCGRSDWADDANQETWVAYHKQLSRGSRPNDPEAWLVTAASRRCAMLIRSESRRRKREQQLDPVAPSNEYGASTTSEEDLLALRHALAQLPERHRLPIVLRYIEEQSIETIAHHFGINANAARVRIHRATQKLKKLIPAASATGLLAGLQATAPAAMTTTPSSLSIISAAGSPGGTTMSLSATALIATGVIAASAAVITTASLQSSPPPTDVSIPGPAMVTQEAIESITTAQVPADTATDIHSSSDAPAVDPAQLLTDKLNQRLTIDFPDMKLEEVTDFLNRRNLGLHFVIDDSIDLKKIPPMTMKLDDVTLEKMLDFLSLQTGVMYLIIPNANGGEIRFTVGRPQ